MGKVKCSCDVGRMHSEPQTATPRGPPSHQGIWAGIDPLNKLKMQLSDVSCQRGEFCLHQTQKKIMLRKASVTYISLCRKKIMLRAPSCSTWNCDADSSSGNCLAAWQDWQNPRRERIHLIRLPLISSSAFLITWKYALQISTKSQMFNMYASVISILSIGNVHLGAECKHDESERKYII